MKKTLFATAFLFITFIGFGQIEEHFFVSSGTTINHTKKTTLGVIDQLGYYVGIGTEHQITEAFHVRASIDYVNQRNLVDNKDLSVQSIFPSFHVKLYPIKNLSAMAGLRLGLVVGSKFGNEKLHTDKGSVLGSFGLGYKIWRFEVNAFYNPAISSVVFDNMMQLGVNYQFH
jgi:hypothetical protein